MASDDIIGYALKSFRSNVLSFVITASVLSILSFTRESRASTLLIKCSTALSKFSIRCNLDSKVDTITSKTLNRYCSLQTNDIYRQFLILMFRQYNRFHSTDLIGLYNDKINRLRLFEFFNFAFL